MRIARTLSGIIAISDKRAFNITHAGGPENIATALMQIDRLPDYCVDASAVDLSSLTLLAPIDENARILCTGFNYRNHAAESDRDVPQKPTFFVRWASSIVGPDEPIILPQASEQLDWEGEVAVVIGHGGRAISAEHALVHVGGYTVFGDHSIRDFQLHGTQATAGKNFDRTGAAGPWIVTPDELPPTSEMELFTRLNDEQVQHGCLSDLVFGVPELIEYVSAFMELRSGDVIATGTPAGIGGRRVPPRWLREGEVISVEVPGIGTITNRVEKEISA